MKHALFAGFLFSALCIPTFASAGPPKATASKKSTASASASQAGKYEFTVEKDTPLEGWEAMHIKGAGPDEGYITYQHAPDTKLVAIHLVKGIKGQPGAGEALKREVLKRYPAKVVISTLSSTNRDRFLDAWGRTFPRHPDESVLRKEVPAMKLDGFNYEVSADHGVIHLKMTPGSGKVTVKDVAELDKILLMEHPKG